MEKSTKIPIKSREDELKMQKKRPRKTSTSFKNSVDFGCIITRPIYIHT